MMAQFVEHVIHFSAAIARSLYIIICTCLMAMGFILRLMGVELLCHSIPLNPKWWCTLLLLFRKVFGIGYLSESVGYFLLYWGSLQYHDLPCCTQFYSNPSNAGKSHRCSSIRLIEVILADENTGIRCRLTTLQDFSRPDEEGKGRYNCLSYTWGEPLTPFGLDVYQGWRARWERDFREKTAVMVFIFGTLLGEPLRLVTDAAQMLLLRFPSVVLSARLAQRGWHSAWMSLSRLASRTLGRKHILICNDQLISVTPNLWDALMTYGPTEESGFDAIWIDALCINQMADREKGDQVKRMHDVYHDCELVVIWLGREHDLEDIETVKEVAGKLKVAQSENSNFWQDLRTDMRRTEIPGITIQDWLQVGRFLSREYWKRKWIFQEVVAARHLTVACGRWKLQWEENCMVSQAWHHFAIRVLAGVNIPGRQEIGVLPRPHLLEVWRNAYREGKEDRLRSKFGKFILQDHRGQFLCQLGHDVLYALVGVCNYPEERLQVTYRKPVSQVYTELWVKVLQTGYAGLSFLCCVEDKSRRKHRGVTETWQKLDPNSGEWQPWAESSLPSWAPDFAMELQPSSLADYYTQETFAAAGKMQFDKDLIGLKISMPDNRLSVKGFLVDTIGITSETGEEFGANFKVPRWLDLILTHIKRPQSPYNSYAARIEALWRSMSVQTDAPGTSWEPRSDTASLCHGWLLDVFSKDILHSSRKRVELHWPQILRLTSNINPADPIHEKDTYGPLNKIHHALGHRKLAKALRRWIPTTKEVKRYSTANWKLLERRGSARGNGRQSRLLKTIATRGYVGTQAVGFGGLCLLNRRLFLTERGYVGKGPKSLQAGDQIWIFAGCTVPLILRKSRESQTGQGAGLGHEVQDQTETYELVGHAYVDGIMHGEAVKAMASADAREVTMI